MSLSPGHLIFDLDGTLVDSAPDLASAINRVLAEEGRRRVALAEVIDMIGDGAPKLVARAFAATGATPDRESLGAIHRRFLAYYDTGLAGESRPYPGVEATLALLRAEGWRFSICTNKPSGPADRLLAAVGLAGWFEVVLGPDRADARKPDPAHVRAVLAAVGCNGGINNAPAVMIGDSHNDVAAGQAAGLAAIAVSYGYGRGDVREFGADHVIDNFAALPMALAALARTGGG